MQNKFITCNINPINVGIPEIEIGINMKLKNFPKNVDPFVTTPYDELIFPSISVAFIVVGVDTPETNSSGINPINVDPMKR